MCGLLQGKSGDAAGKLTPIHISKVNTVVQLVTVASYISHAAYQWPPPELLSVSSWATAVTTAASTVGYVKLYLRGA